ncbi:hypothetical protein [Novosphingobium sp. 9]|uniref:hypothetical protein n=1 Tax=Novosphingobium sp. 9 TaxID=2025349 RepID=UPI0021B5CD39|nr:hypothetical protein [Novosphingobium sp. 9]
MTIANADRVSIWFAITKRVSRVCGMTWECPPIPYGYEFASAKRCGLLRSRKAGVPAYGRRWPRVSRESQIYKRRSEIADLALALLGGHVAARDFLSGIGPDRSRSMLEFGCACASGQAQIVHLFWKIAAHRMRAYQ